MNNSRWWIGATAIGWAGIAVAITILTYTHVAAPVSQADGTVVQTSVWDNAGAIAFSVSGVLVAAPFMGICQSLALRFPLSKALWWIAMNVAVFLIASAIVIFWVRGAGGMFGIPVFFAAYSPVYAAISGALILQMRP